MRFILLSLCVAVGTCNLAGTSENQSGSKSALTPIPTPQTEASRQGPVPVTHDMAIAAAFEVAAYGRSWWDENKKSVHEDAFDPRADGTWFLFRRKTVRPPAIPEDAAITPDLRENFLNANGTSERLDDDYDVKFGLKPSESHEPDEILFQRETALAKKSKDPSNILRAVVAISQPGFDVNHTRSLVYARLYNPVIGTQERFILVHWKKEGMGVMTDGVEWF